ANKNAVGPAAKDTAKRRTRSVIVRRLFLMMPAIAFGLISVGSIVAILIRTGSSADSPGGTSTAAAKSPSEIAADVERRAPISARGSTPKLALVFTGWQDGYIEPCGCSGKENQKGGLSRRDMLFKRLREQKWPIVALDVGEQVRRYGK